MPIKKTKQPAESTNQRRIVRTSELRSSQYIYHGDRRERTSGIQSNVPRQMRRPDEKPERGQAQSARGEQLGKLIRRRRFVYSVIGAIVIGVIFGSLYIGTSPTIQLVKGYEDQQTLRQTEVYQREASKYLSKSLANHSKITVDGQGLERHMRSMFPELQLIELTLPAVGSQPILVIQPSKPLVALQTSTSGSYIVDESGFAIATAESFTGTSLPIVVDQTALIVKLGSQVLPKSSIRFISSVLAQYEAKSLSVESLILPQSAYELNVRTVGDSYYVKYSMMNGETTAQQIGSYFTMRDYLVSKKVSPSEYVDVRTSGRAYYK